METTPLISIIVPVYNLAAELGRCVGSIIAQTYQNIEIIMVDDGSADNSLDVIRSLADRDSRIIPLHKKNGGVTKARLIGIEAAHGEWIGFVDGDDEIEPDMFERLLDNAQKFNADISHCGYRMCFSDGRINYFYNTGRLVEQDHDRGLIDLLEGTEIEPGLCNKLYRRELFDGLASQMDCSIRINEDLLMNFYLFMKAERAVFEDWCPYHYIVRSTSASRAKPNQHKMYDPLRVRQLILQQAPETIIPWAERALVTTCIYSYCGLMSERGDEATTARSKLRGELIEHYDWCQALPGRTKLLAAMIVKIPGVLSLIYPVYTKCLQKKRYN